MFCYRIPAPCSQGKFELLPPAPPYYPFPRGKSILGVIYGVLLWADMNAATPLGAWGRSVMGGALILGVPTKTLLESSMKKINPMCMLQVHKTMTRNDIAWVQKALCQKILSKKVEEFLVGIHKDLKPLLSRINVIVRTISNNTPVLFFSFFGGCLFGLVFKMAQSLGLRCVLLPAPWLLGRGPTKTN